MDSFPEKAISDLGLGEVISTLSFPLVVDCTTSVRNSDVKPDYLRITAHDSKIVERVSEEGSTKARPLLFF